MNISLRSKEAELMTDDLKEFAEKKMGTLQRLVGEAADIRIDFSKESNHHKTADVFKVGIEINTHGERYFTEESSQDFKTSINRAKEELQRQIGAKKGADEAKRRDAAKTVRDLKESS